jgi:hypothetical protein
MCGVAPIDFVLVGAMGICMSIAKSAPATNFKVCLVLLILPGAIRVSGMYAAVSGFSYLFFVCILTSLPLLIYKISVYGARVADMAGTGLSGRQTGEHGCK